MDNRMLYHQSFVDQILKDLGLPKTEAGSFNSRKQQLLMLKYAKDRHNILETGFNAGHSACLFLSQNPEVTVKSFDLGAHPYSKPCAEYLKERFPGRLEVIFGDSRKTLKPHDSKYDLIFIDGGHSYEVAKHDLSVALSIIEPNGVILMDDITKKTEKPYNVGPNKAWKSAIVSGNLTEIDFMEWADGRGMAVGTRS